MASHLVQHSSNFIKESNTVREPIKNQQFAGSSHALSKCISWTKVTTELDTVFNNNPFLSTMETSLSSYNYYWYHSSLEVMKVVDAPNTLTHVYW